MLTIIITGKEFFNEETNEFETHDQIVLELEHSLVSVSKWESKFKKPFLGSEGKSREETLEYIKAMIVSPKNPGEVFSKINQQHIDLITEYIESTESATTFGEMPQRKVKGEVITSELIYYWMVAFNIPFECETWHLNRLFSLIRICNIKNSKPKRMSRNEIAMRNRELNARRRAELGTSG